MHRPRDLPALDLLKAFEASARHLSFTKAGQELFLSQSAISRQIAALEEQLGTQLFLRRVRSLLLTEAGQAYYREVGDILQKLREATARLSRPQSNGVVTVTTSLTFASLWLVPRLSGFQRKHPEVSVHLVADNNIRDLIAGGIDVSVRYSTRELAGPGAEKLFGERVVPVCAPALVAGRSLDSAKDLQEFTLLHYEDPEGRGLWLSWDVWFEVMKLRSFKPRASLRFSHYDQMMQAALDGQGVALGRVPLVEPWIREGRLVTPLKDKRYSINAKNRAYWLLIAPLAAKRSQVRAFTSWLKEQVA
jgi:LysR family transcriptional regulator, glycine cleavage system transcriptional activator